MRNTLLLRADSLEQDIWRWLRLDIDGRPVGGIRLGSLHDAAGEATGHRVVVMVPGVRCLLTRVQIPGGNRQRLLRAVPYALEEQLTDDVERLHFAVGRNPIDGEWPVVVIDRDYMERLTAAAVDAGIDMASVVPDILLVPRDRDETSVLLVDELALVRTGETDGYAVDNDNLTAMLGLPADADGAPSLHIMLREGTRLRDEDSYPRDVRIETFSVDSMHIFAQGVDAAGINLLQGDFSKAGEWGKLLQPWRSTAALLAAGVLVAGLLAGVDYYRLSLESEQLQQQIESTFRQALPEVKRIVNPRVQMQQELDKLQRGQGEDTGFLSLLGKTGSVLQSMQGIELGAITFRAGRLDVDLKAGSLQLLDQLKQALIGAGGLQVEIQTATTGKDQRVQSRLRIEGAG